MLEYLRRLSTPAALATAALAALLTAHPAPAQSPTATPAPPVTPPATPAVGVARVPEATLAADPDAALVADPETTEAPKLRPWQKQQMPPDGKWLKDDRGREYYVRKFKKPGAGGFLRITENSVRLPGGFTIDIVGEDSEFFLGKIYRTDNIQMKPSGKVEPTAAELAAKEAEYKVATTASDRVRFAPIGQGLPDDGQWRNSFDVADVNGDGKLDILHGGVRRQLNAQPYLFLGDGKGGFKVWSEARYPPVPYDYGGIAAGDFNKDGKVDLALAVHLRGLVALFGDGKGKFELGADGLGFEAGALKPGQIALFSSRAIVALDWDGDGRDEILALAEGPMGSFAAGKDQTTRLQQSYGVAMYKLGADGNWQAMPGGKTHPELFGDSLVTGDFNGDGKIDFAAGSNSRSNAALVHLHLDDGSWSYSWVDSLRPRAFARAVAAGDLDGDKRDELVVGYQSAELSVWRTGIDVYKLGADGKFSRQGVFAEPGSKGFFALATGDLDGDGKPDIAAGTGDGRIFVFLNDGKGGFTQEDTAQLAVEASCRVYDVAIRDLDRDKRGDLVAAFAGEECPEGGKMLAWRSIPSASPR
jgi:hypothetical protein